MKRPLLVIGSSMLLTFLLITNITHKMTIALLIGAVVIFLLFLTIKALRKYQTVILSLIGVIIFTSSFAGAEKYYFNESDIMKQKQTLTGVVCQMPTQTDFATSYIIKPDGKNYKIRFVSEGDLFIREGDYVKMSLTGYDEYEETDMFENSLSSKVFFTFFESDKCTIEKTGDTNLYYQKIGVLKRGFSDIVDEYLPGDIGILAKAITIGDKSQLDDSIVDNFRYSGSSHLLVISGLHLSLWSFGIMKYLDKFSRTRKYSHLIGIFCLFVFSSITGFTVSVIRAGTMVLFVLMARIFNREADNLNSIGAGVTFILFENPFAPFSASLWLTVLSTVGMIVYSGKLKMWLNEKFRDKPISKLPVFSKLVTAIAISFATSVFTLPVFIFKLKMFTIASTISNFLMVTPAMIMMVTTVLGVVCHLLHIYPFARLCYLIAGLIGKMISFVAEKIGMWDWSTISLNHKYYEYFLIILILSVVAVVILKKYRIDLLKQMSVVLSVAFCILAVYCTNYNYHTPSMEVLFTSDKPVITIFSENKSVLVGVQPKKYAQKIKYMLCDHNEKRLDNIIVTEDEDITFSQILYLHGRFGRAKTHFSEEAYSLFKENATGNVTNLSLSESANINFTDTEYIEIQLKNKSVLLVDCKKAENVYENLKKYDIILIYGKNPQEYENILKEKFDDTEIILGETGKSLSIH